jgi:deoxyribose-phosphate aldolase
MGWVDGIVAEARDIAAAWKGPAAAPPTDLTAEQLAGMIDHTLLKPEATPDMVAALCDEARAYRFASVCVNPAYVAQCAAALAGSGVPVCAVAGFPLGATLADVKAYEARRAIEDGAREVDMVINVGALKAGQLAQVRDDIAAVTEVCHAHNALCKVIIEAVLLTDEEKVQACLVAVDAGADFVKTSTGFASGGATLHDVALMRATVGTRAGVKAAGGIRDYQTAIAMVAAGANRIGASAGVAIVRAAMPAKG